MAKRATEEIEDEPGLGEAANPREVHAQRERERVTAATEKDDLLVVLSTPAGRRYFARVLSICKVGQVVFDGDSRWTDFLLGHQNVGNQLLAQAREHCIELVRLMEDEARNGR